MQFACITEEKTISVSRVEEWAEQANKQQHILPENGIHHKRP